MSNEDTPKARDRAHLVAMRYRFPKGAKDGTGTTLASFTIRETDTYDIAAAARQSDANGTIHGMELLAISITKVNGQPLATGSIDGWNQIAIDFAQMVYGRLNSFKIDDAEALIKAGEVDPA